MQPSNNYVGVNSYVPLTASKPKPQGNYAVTVEPWNFAGALQLNAGARQHTFLTNLPDDRCTLAPFGQQRRTLQQNPTLDDYDSYLGPVPTQSGS